MFLLCTGFISSETTLNADADTRTRRRMNPSLFCFFFMATHAHIAERYHVCCSDVPKSLSAPPLERVGGFLLHAHTHRQQAWERGRKRIRARVGCVCASVRQKGGQSRSMLYLEQSIY